MSGAVEGQPATMAERIAAIEIDPAELEAHPHEVCARHRAQVPFFFVPPLNIAYILRYNDLQMLLTDARTRQIEKEFIEFQGVTVGGLHEIYEFGMLFSNGEVHRSRRKPMVKTFAFKLIERMRPRIRQIAEELLSSLRGQNEIDYLHKFAAVIPGLTIADILGVPEDDVPQFINWVDWGVRGMGMLNQEELPQIEEGCRRLVDYSAGLLDQRRATPLDDFLTDYVRTNDESGELSREEVIVQVAGTIMAGADTTRSALCGTLSLLLQHPEQWRAFCADPAGLKKPVVEEGVRYEPAAAAVPRYVMEDLEVGGAPLKSGTVMGMSFLSALRDPEIYSDPETFNIYRTDHPRWHPAFGAGPHRCLGEALARAELEESLAVIAEQAPGTRLVGAPPHIGAYIGVRHVDRMVVDFG